MKPQGLLPSSARPSFKSSARRSNRERELTCCPSLESYLRADASVKSGPATLPLQGSLPHRGRSWISTLSADGYTIKLKATVSAPETLNGEVNMYDHQTLLLSTTEKTKPDSQLIVLLTATLVDPVG